MINPIGLVAYGAESFHARFLRNFCRASAQRSLVWFTNMGSIDLAGFLKTRASHLANKKNPVSFVRPGF